jgi:hypothetical protein
MNFAVTELTGNAFDADFLFSFSKSLHRNGCPIKRLCNRSSIFAVVFKSLPSCTTMLSEFGW